MKKRASKPAELGKGQVRRAPSQRARPRTSDSEAELAELNAKVAELAEARRRLSRLYTQQLEENHLRSAKLHQVLQSLREINSELDLDTLLNRIAETIRSCLGFRVVLIRIREPGTDRLRARALAGGSTEVSESLAANDVRVADCLSWLRDEFKVSQSYFIGHNHVFSLELPGGHASNLGPREKWEWHENDVLLVPLFDRKGDLLAYFSVDDPADRLVPTREVVELLEIFGNHAVVAIENARLYGQLENHTRELEAAGTHMHEMHTLKSNFVSTISHELRTPLTAIRAYVDTLMSAREGDLSYEQVHQFLAIINQESSRLARLIESVLDLNRFDSAAIRPTRQDVELAELVEEAAGVLGPMAQVGQVSLKVVRSSADTRVDANRDQMRQLVLHLGSNAVKFTPPGGAVTLAFSGDDQEVVLQVQDTGIGIPEKSLDKVFERFYQVDSSLVRRYGGTGLGLAICKSIVDWHGGRIVAESQPGQGSRFTVAMPRRLAPRVILRSGSNTSATDDLLRLAVELVSEVMGANVVSILAPGDDEALVIHVAIGLDARTVREARIPIGTGVAGWVAEKRRPVCVAGEGDELDLEVAGSGRSRYRSRTFLSVPLEGENGILGVLNVTDPVANQSFDAESCHLLLHLAQRVAAAWEQAMDMECAQAGVEDTAHALRQVLKHLERSRRVSPDRVRLARGTARAIGLSESEIGVISFAASIHDVGMRELGEHVVEGGGALSSEDREAMERHPELGADLLQPLDRVGVVREVVLSHHEWWDGSGYPRGLQGAEIPMGGRILAAVDAFESMTVGRAHRAPRSRDEALRELHRLSGQQFDPAVVDAFETALAELHEQDEVGPGTGRASKSTEARR